MAGIDLHGRLAVRSAPVAGDDLTDKGLAFAIPRGVPMNSCSLVITCAVGNGTGRIVFSTMAYAIGRRIAPPRPKTGILIFGGRVVKDTRGHSFNYLLAIASTNRLSVRATYCVGSSPALGTSRGGGHHSRVSLVTGACSNPTFTLTGFSGVTRGLQGFGYGKAGLFAAIGSSTGSGRATVAVFPKCTSVRAGFLILRRDVRGRGDVVSLIGGSHLIRVSRATAPSLFSKDVGVSHVAIRDVGPNRSINESHFSLGKIIIFGDSGGNGVKIVLVHRVGRLSNIDSTASTAVIFSLCCRGWKRSGFYLGWVGVR